jgi:hypothetical protein
MPTFDDTALDTLTLTSSARAGLAMFGKAFDSFTLTGQALSDHLRYMAGEDLITLSSAPSDDTVVKMARDRLRLTGKLMLQLVSSRAALDRILFSDRAQYVAVWHPVDALLLTDSTALSAEVLMLSRDLIRFTDDWQIRMALSLRGHDSVTLTGLTLSLLAMDASDALRLIDAASLWRDVTLPAEDSLTWTDGVQAWLLQDCNADDALVLRDAAQTSFAVSFLASDQILFVPRLPLGDQDYQLWVTNTHTMAVSQYKGLALDSVVAHGTQLIGVGPDGVYVQDGVSDDGEPISCLLRTGYIGFGAEEDKNVYRAYLYMKSGGPVYLRVIWDAGGRRDCKWYQLDARDPDVLENRRVPLARGVRAERWGFEITNVDGGDLELREFSVLPAILRPRP